MVYIELVPESTILALIDRLRYVLEKLDPAPQAGQMRARSEKSNASRKSRLIDAVDDVIEQLRNGKDSKVVRTLASKINSKIDGKGSDWVAGPSVADIQALLTQIDATL